MAPKQPVAGPSKPRASVNAPAQSPPPPSALSAFSPSGSLFALAHPALGSADKLTIWDVEEDKVVTEWEIEGASKASSVCWVSTSSAGSHGKKKRKKNDGEVEDVVVVTTTKGQLFSFSPSRGVQRRLDLPSPALASAASEQGLVLVSTTSLHLISSDLSSLTASIPLLPNTASPTALAVLSSSTAESIHLVIASSSATVLHVDLATHKITESSSSIPVSTSSVTSLIPLPTSSQGTSFLVISDDDRTVSQYTIPSGNKARLSYRYASPTLSPAHSASLHASYLSILHKSGEISLFPLPTTLDLNRPKSDSKPSAVRFLEGKTERQARICRAGFSSTEGENSIVAGHMLGAGRIRWSRAAFIGADGSLLPEVRVRCDGQDLVAKADKNAGSLQRFSAPAATTELPSTDSAAATTLPTDVDMADLSLGERLLAMPNGTGTAELPNGVDAKSKAAPTLDGPVNAQSLTRLLVQALHTSDPALLSLCLSHRDPVLIRNTIRKMPAQLALPLLKACVERLGQGKGANKRGGGRGAGQNEQQGRGTVEWVKGVLVERGAILMTMPSLPAQLSSLSRLLDTRLQLYQPLLSLSGRLDLALAQISMRRIALEQANSAKQGEDQGAHYIEGESDDEEVEVEMGDGEGEVEDVDMRLNGSDSEEDEDSSDEEESGSEDEDDDEDDEEEDPLESDDGGLLELEAEESEDEGSGESSEED
ncbi:uncharacterized protein MKK02DRAFT_23265 [Dioszegia hungarica]|uniref:Small-subunit processome Utp12 domain-containing protein n=1 Tax=Dioszegia hungarica TaxID=4972 RepID=A0AA38HD86_9TREE|nr:uncharacterized protein MKK02DRAFT_23265 [Dioszegia hungarica]KAI9638530.1 hypothetical protein MKK02DRAFT_23265 [Dioszegia hungarica]